MRMVSSGTAFSVGVFAACFPTCLLIPLVNTSCFFFSASVLVGSTLNEDIQLETDGQLTLDEDTPVNSEGSYFPRVALTRAISDWMQEFYVPCDAVKVKMVDMAPPPTVVRTCTAEVDTTTSTTPSAATVQPQCSTTPLVTTNLNELATVNTSFMQPTSILQANSLVDPFSSDSEADSASEGCPEPMDCLVTPGTSPAQDLPLTAVEIDKTEPGLPMEEPVAEEMDSEDKLTAKDVALLVDMFYLPFEYGFQGSCMLCQLHWLKINAHHTLEARLDSATAEQKALGEEWMQKCVALQDTVHSIHGLLRKLRLIPNQSLHQDLYPYLWDLACTLSLVDTYVSWLGMLLCSSRFDSSRFPFFLPMKVAEGSFSLLSSL